MLMMIMGWFFGWRMAINEDIAAMELVCQRMRRLLVSANPEAYYMNDAGALIRRLPDGTETVVTANPTPFNAA